MTVRNFEDLKIWQTAKQLTKQVYAATSQEKYHCDYSLVDQTWRAAVSVMANIAEGFERENNKEFIQYLYVAKGSCGELRSHLWIAEELAFLTAKDGSSLRSGGTIDHDRKIDFIPENLADQRCKAQGILTVSNDQTVRTYKA